MKKELPPMGEILKVLVLGLLLGTVFSFGMQYWSEEVTREECEVVDTIYLEHELLTINRAGEHEIAIDCANGERYFIHRVSVNNELRNDVWDLPEQSPITLLIHPNSNDILEFETEDGLLLEFDETIAKISEDGDGFMIFGIFGYFAALVSLYYLIRHGIHKLGGWW